MSAIMWTCWLPYMVLTYPGVLWFDTTAQLAMYHSWRIAPSSGMFNDHHPFMDTLVFGWFLDLGNRLGSAASGLFALILIQGFLACLALTHLETVILRLGCNRQLVAITHWFLSLFPFVPMMFATLVKDTLFTVVFIWFLALFIELCASHGEKLPDWRFCVQFIVAILAMSLSKKLGVYIAAFSMLAAMLVLGKLRWRMVMTVGAILSLLFMQVVIPDLLLPALHIHKGDSTDMFVVPIQQTARMAHYHPDEFNERDRMMVASTLHTSVKDLGARYVWFNADPAKATGMSDHADSATFLGWSLEKATAHPAATFVSWLGIQQAWFSPTTGREANMATGGLDTNRNVLQPIFDSSNHDTRVQQIIDLQLGTPESDVIRSWYHTLLDIPVVNMLFSKALWATLIPGCVLFVVLQRREKERGLRLVMTIPVLLSSASLFISPLSVSPEGTRYALPLVMTGLYMLIVAASRVGTAHCGSFVKSSSRR